MTLVLTPSAVTSLITALCSLSEHVFSLEAILNLNNVQNVKSLIFLIFGYVMTTPIYKSLENFKSVDKIEQKL